MIIDITERHGLIIDVIGRVFNFSSRDVAALALHIDDAAAQVADAFDRYGEDAARFAVVFFRVVVSLIEREGRATRNVNNLCGITVEEIAIDSKRRVVINGEAKAVVAEDMR